MLTYKSILIVFRGKKYTSVITKTYYENQITESLFTTASKNHNANLAKLNIRIESGTKTTGNISKTINYRPCFRQYFVCSLLFFTEVDYKNNVVPIVVDGLKNDYLKTFLSPSSSPSNSIVYVLYLHSLINDVIYLKSISLEFPAR